MGIDLIRGGRIANRGFRTTKSSNNYLKSLIKVHIPSRSFTLSCKEELIPNLIKLFIRDSTSQDLTDILFQSPESSSISQLIALPSPREKPSSILESWLLLEQSPTISDYLTCLRDLEFVLLSLLKLLAQEFRLPKALL